MTVTEIRVNQGDDAECGDLWQNNSRVPIPAHGYIVHVGRAKLVCIHQDI
jgi:hypothetical protein